MGQTDGMLYIICDQESAGTLSAWDRVVLQPGNKKIGLIAGEPESKRVKALRFRLCCFCAFTGRQQEVDCGRPLGAGKEVDCGWAHRSGTGDEFHRIYTNFTKFGRKIQV